MGVPKCYGNYMDCSECSAYTRCKALKPSTAMELRKICIRCEKCIFGNTCALTTLKEITR